MGFVQVSEVWGDFEFKDDLVRDQDVEALDSDQFIFVEYLALYLLPAVEVFVLQSQQEGVFVDVFRVGAGEGVVDIIVRANDGVGEFFVEEVGHGDTDGNEVAGG